MPAIVAALSVHKVTFAEPGTTMRAVRQANISALVEEGYKIADAEKVNSS